MSARFLPPLLMAVLSASAPAAVGGAKSVWDGVYTTDQATRGANVYAIQCSRCHGNDLSGAGGVLTGAKFMSDWREDTVGSFFKILRQTMPANAPASLPDAGYADLTAYVLQINGFPAGSQELKPDALDIRIQDKKGPQEVPDFSLVEVVGCLTQAPDRDWIVKQASEPVRTRNPGDPTPEEAKALAARPLGTHTFRLLDPLSVQSHPPNGHKVELKGFLIRKPGDDRVNPSSLQSVASACGATP